MQMKHVRHWFFMGLLTWLVGCSPSENWRVITLYDYGVTAMIPCKPDEAQRQVPMPGGAAPLEMRSCELDGTTYAVAWLPVQSADQGEAAMRAWLQGCLASARVTAPSAVERIDVPHAQQAWRWRGEGQSQGQSLRIEFHFVHQGKWLVQLATFQRGENKLRDFETFWGGLTLPKSQVPLGQ